MEGGKKYAYEIDVGDRLWSRDENDASGELRLQVVEERFVSLAEIWNLRVGGQVLRTTSEHPFWVPNRGEWLPARELSRSDLLLTRAGDVVVMEGVENAGIIETVYNWRVAEYHTYFVSAGEDGESLWAHNACSGRMTNEEKAQARALVAGGMSKRDAIKYVKGQREQHHSDPVFMGGDPKQPTTPLPMDTHRGAGDSLHNDLNAFLRSKTDAAGNHMRPQRGNSGKKIRGNFDRQTRLQVMAEFYKTIGAKYRTAARDFFNQHPHLQ